MGYGYSFSVSSWDRDPGDGNYAWVDLFKTQPALDKTYTIPSNGTADNRIGIKDKENILRTFRNSRITKISINFHGKDTNQNMMYKTRGSL